MLTFLCLELFTRKTLPRWWGIVLAVLCIPVPWAKHHLRDHTATQLAAGSAAGIISGIIYFALLRCCLLKCMESVASTFRLKDNYNPGITSEINGEHYQRVDNEM
jgi:hypothetical protein